MPRLDQGWSRNASSPCRLHDKTLIYAQPHGSLGVAGRVQVHEWPGSGVADRLTGHVNPRPVHYVSDVNGLGLPGPALGRQCSGCRGALGTPRWGSTGARGPTTSADKTNAVSVTLISVRHASVTPIDNIRHVRHTVRHGNTYPSRMSVTMQKRHPECPDVHLGLCRECERLYERDRIAADRLGVSEIGASTIPDEAVSVQDDVDAGDVVVEPPDSDPVTDAPPKSEKLAVAKSAMEGAVTREARSAADRSARYRERKKLSDPEFLEREAARKREMRRKRDE